MFNRLVHLLKTLGQDSTQVVQDSVRLIAENSTVNELTNYRPKGFNREAVLKGHNKIGDFIHRGVQIQTHKIKEGI